MQKETRENFLAVSCQNGFGMKLHAIHGELAMTQCHDFAVVAFRDDLKTRGKGTPLDNQRVASNGIGKSEKSPFPLCLIVDDFPCTRLAARTISPPCASAMH